MPQTPFNPAILAPGDTKSVSFDTTGLEIVRVRTPDHPMFDAGYGRLLHEFGGACEIESRDVLLRRLGWAGSGPLSGFAMRYEMLVATRDSEIAAIRDHTAIVNLTSLRPTAIVHLSHVLIEPQYRRTGLAGWMRALPIETARELLALHGLNNDAAITLVAEMEHPEGGSDEARGVRLAAYERAGFQKVDPTAINYLQPDFRDVAEIDVTGARPLSFVLIVRRVGREGETSVAGQELRDMVESLYRMYAASLRPADVEPLIRSLEHYPPAAARVRLLPPTA